MRAYDATPAWVLAIARGFASTMGSARRALDRWAPTIFLGLSLALMGLAGLSWIAILGITLAVWSVQVASEARQSRWVREWLSPGIDDRRSWLLPRVWTFQVGFLKAFCDELLQHTSAKDVETLRLLSRLKIEEFASRIRVHRWTEPVADRVEGEPPRYEWWDLRHKAHWFLYGDKPRLEQLRGAFDLWDMDVTRPPDTKSSIPPAWQFSTLKLSASWTRGPGGTWPPILTLTLWVDDHDDGEHSRDESIILQVPLDPGLLDDQRGEKVFVRGQQKRASEVLPYPLDEGEWAGDSRAGRWYLHMQTYDKNPPGW